MYIQSPTSLLLFPTPSHSCTKVPSARVRAGVRLIVAAALLLSWPQSTFAQGFGAGPGGIGGPNPGGPQGNQKEGPAEAAPDDDIDEPELPPLPAWPGLERKQIQFFELHGYFRFRTDLRSNHSLGYPDATVNGVRYIPPFPTQISESETSQQNCAARKTGDPNATDVGGCPGDTLAGANIRLRLEPTINVADTVRVHMQVDIFDNLVLGSTPNNIAGTQRDPGTPLEFLSNSQAAPVSGLNSDVPSIVVKRAWAEVVTPLGTFEAGRMPFQWGLGIYANDGGCWDCSYGDNVDRIKFTTHKLWGHNFGMGFDFGASGPNTFSVSNSSYAFGGQAVDLEQLDDVAQWFWFAGRIDDEQVIRDRVLRGDVVINYGLMLLYRYQDWSFATNSPSSGAPTGLGASVDDFAQSLVLRDAWTLTPDLWFKLRYKHLSIDVEGLFIGGNIANVDQTNSGAEMSIAQFGWVARGEYRFLRDKLKLRLELGMASGDETEPENQDINKRRSYPLRDPNGTSSQRNDTALNQFRFNYDYLVDLILFREILGTVANAAYVKPTISYDILGTLTAQMDIIYSMAHQAVAYPGNTGPIGLELDLNLFYRDFDDGVWAGVQYGVMFPFGALNRPVELDNGGTAVPFFPASIAGDAKIAQALRAHLIVKF